MPRHFIRSRFGFASIWLAWLVLAGLPQVSAQARTVSATAPLPCEAEGAIKTEITGPDAEGTFQLAEGYRVRLANIIWPDHLEPGRRNALTSMISAALQNQHVSWKPAAGPDRWGITPVHLFVQEKDGTLAPFWLQAGLVEAGIVPFWPDPAHADCLKRLAGHEAVATRHRRGYWAPRAQAARHRVIAAAPEVHAGRRIVARWQVKSVKAWRSLHFVNFMPSFRGAASLALTQKQVTQLTGAGRNPSLWTGKWIVARVIVGGAGLTRLRVETIDHIGVVE